jgi:hypothetical protein
MEHPMLYSKIYESIVERAKNRILTEYSEKHHILPKCLGGTDESDNLVRLTFREHFLCHQLLCKIYTDNQKLIFAFSSMVRVSRKNAKRFDVLTSRHFDLVKKTLAPHMGKWNKGRTAWNKGLSGESHTKHYKAGKIKIPNLTGYKWINDGLNQTKIPPGTEIPNGWFRGRIDIKGVNNPMKNKETSAKNADLRKKK